MRSLLFLLTALPLFAAVSDYQFGGSTSTQAIVTFSVADPAQCSIVVYSDAARTKPAHDANVALFPNAAACNRPDNIVNGTQVTAVLGKRRVENAADGKAYSRALAADTHYWGRITEGASTLNFEFNTENIPWGQAYNDPLPALQPYLSPTDAEPVIDPHTGATVYRLTLAKDIVGDHTLTHANPPATPAGWTNVNNVVGDDSNPATVVNSTTPLFVPISNTAVGNPGVSQPQNDGSHTAAGLSVNKFSILLNAWRNSGTVNLEIALSVDGGASPATNWRTVSLNTCSSSCTSGNRITTGGNALYLGDWISTALPSFDVTALPAKSGSVNVSGSTVTWTWGTFFDPIWPAGTQIVLNGATCTIASVDTERTLTLASPCGSTGAYSVRPFGVLVRATANVADPVQVQFISSTVTLGLNSGWDPGGLAQGNFTCSPVVVSGGRLCFAVPGLYWFNISTGARTFLGISQLPYDPSTDGWPALWCSNWVWDATDGNKGYCYISSYQKLVAMKYNGSYSDAGPGTWNVSMPRCGSAPCWTMSNVLPPSQNLTIAEQFARWSPAAAAFVTQYGGVGVSFAAQRGAYMEFVVRPAGGWTNDTTGWTVILNPATQTVIAVSPPSRWSGTHGGEAIDVPGWTILTDVTHRGPWGGSDPTDGNGPYKSTVAQQMLATTSSTCPAWPGSGPIPEDQWPVTANGGRCATLVTSGQPADPAPGTHEGAGFRPYDVAPGDLLVVCAPNGPSYVNMAGCDNPGLSSEVMRILSVTDSTHWVVQRGYAGQPYRNNPQNMRQHNVNDWIFMISSSCFVGPMYGCGASGNRWNFLAEPNGPSSIAFDPLGKGSGHQFYAGGWHVANVSDVAPVIDGTAYNAYNVRRGGLMEMLGAPNRAVALNAPFEGLLGVGNPLAVDGHPSCTHCPVNNTFFVDARPFLGEVALTGCSVDTGSRLVCGTLPRYRPKYMPTLATVGSRVLKDVSGPGSVLGATKEDAYKRCTAVLPNECVTGSTAGKVYVNRGTSSQTNCFYQGVGGSNMDVPGVCVIDNGSFTQGITQTRLADQSESAGANTRVLTRAFSSYYRTDQFWGAKTDPVGQWVFFRSRWAGGVRDEVFAVKIPPLDAPTYRGGFHRVPVKINASPSASHARVRFGYNAAFQCTTDSDSCVTGGTPWSYARENPAPTACSSGCTILAPAIPGRPFYYRVERTNAAGALVATGATQVVVP
jgi:hypothetical protein